MAPVETLTADIAGTTSTASHARAAGQVPVLGPPPGMPFVTIDLGEIDFSIALDGYLAARGIDQRHQRPGLVSRMLCSSEPEKRILQVLERIAERPSEDRLAAAIDLLRLLGRHVVDIALRQACAAQPVDDDAAFVLASAAARADKQVIRQFLVRSPHEPMREAAMEVLPGLPAEEAKPMLDKLAREDSSQYIKSRAAELLREVG